ncbi:alpha/beta fold hydrolase [Sphaerotilaceae bacterium SBD11-9]
MRRIVLIHGAWQGAWAFEAWTALLAARGWVPHAVDLPGNGWPPLGQAPASLAAYTEHVAGVVCQFDEPVVVLGHSGGGITATQVAEAVPQRVAAVVYLAGMMLPSGRRFGDLVRGCEAEHAGADLRGITPYLELSDDGLTSRVPPQAALDIFLHDCEPAAARRAAALLRPQPESGRAMHPTWTPERAGRVPRVYVECTQDRSVLPVVQQAMQRLTPGAHRIALDCGHVPQLARPAELTERLCAVLDTLLASRPAAPPFPTPLSHPPTPSLQDTP